MSHEMTFCGILCYFFVPDPLLGFVPSRRDKQENWPVTTYIMAHRVLDRVPVLDMSAVGRGETLARAVVCDHTSHMQHSWSGLRANGTTLAGSLSTESEKVVELVQSFSG